MITIDEHVELKGFTTLKIGGRARYFAVVTTTEELKEAISVAKEKNVSVVVLGGGSNTLIAGEEIDALVMKVEIKGVEWVEEGNSVVVTSGAGESWDGLVAQSVERGLWGIENLSGVPGSVGAAPIQNIGAYGTEVREVIEWVEVFDTKTGEIKKLTNEECRFGYRDSIFKHPEGKSLVVTRVAFRLHKDGVPNLVYKDLQNYFYEESNSSFPKGGGESSNRRISKSLGLRPLLLGKGELPTLAEIRNAVIEIRSKKFPDLNEFGTAGSFFKNPIIPEAQFNELKKKFPNLPGFPLPSTLYPLPSVKVPLAWVLDNICGLKGFEKGNVKLFEKQPIVLVQNGLATAEEVETFAKEIISQVKSKTGISIEWEVQKIS